MQVKLFDTTLRDGTQSENISLSLGNKLEMVKLLDDFGIDYIEAGWPGSNEKDIAFFEKIRHTPPKHAKITAFGSTRRKHTAVQEDHNLLQLIASRADTACIFGKSWILHVQEALRCTPEENLSMIEESVAFLQANLPEVIYDAEHFFDGYKDNPEYALQTLLAAQRGGADNITLCDTNGGTLPWEVFQIVSEVRQKLQTPLGIHTHNDSEVAVANALEGVRAGAELVQGTINGYGERCGNVNLLSLIGALKCKMNVDCISAENLRKMRKLSLAVCEIVNIPEQNYQAYTGRSAFAHKGGIHASAIQRNSSTYEHIDPQLVGNEQRILASELSGVSNLQHKIERLGLADLDSTVLRKVLQELKAKEAQGYSFEGADASLELFMLKATGTAVGDYFRVERYRVVDDYYRGADTSMGANSQMMSSCEATVRVVLPNGECRHCAADGKGPVDALYGALERAIRGAYPDVFEGVRLIDYRVRILDHKEGTGARTRVSIETTDGDMHWTTIGVGQDIIAASFNALLDATIYKLYKSGIQTSLAGRPLSSQTSSR